VSLPEASVVIPTFNAGPGFEATLDQLSAQQTDFSYEVLVVDSGSTDGTVELARGYGVSVHPRPRIGFDHGATRDLAVSLCRGRYVALLVQDAVPIGGRWLAALVQNLRRDPLVAGVYGRQCPRPESGPLARVLANDRPTASAERREQFAGGPHEYHSLSPAERRRLAAFDNVNSCLRRSVWEEIPFGRTGFGEDLRWGKRVVEAGYKLVYEPHSAVLHSHERDALYDLRRHYVEGRLLQDLFGLAPVASLPSLLWNVLLSSAHLYRGLRRGGKVEGLARALALAARYAFPSQLGAYLAVKNRELAAKWPRLSSRVSALLSEGI
jgi:glycosyltransferase involved in cell wall biosynthesis